MTSSIGHEWPLKAQALADFVVECTIVNREVGGQEEIDKPVQNKDRKRRKILRRLLKNTESSILMERIKQKQVEQAWSYKDLKGS